MADLTAIAAQLAGQIEQTQRHDFATTNENLICHSTLVNKINPPCAAIALQGAVLDIPASETAPGMDSIEFLVIIYASRWSDLSAGEEALRAYLSTSGPTSIRQAILEDPKLNGLLEGGTARVNGWNPPGEAVVGDVHFLAVELLVSVTCTKDRIQRRQ